MNAYRQQQLRAPVLYRYHGIMYTYGDLQQARRRQNALFHAALEKENYNEASRIFDTDPREFLPQIAEQQTGDKRTLTPRRKCGIIKAIQRYVRRWKRKQEGKTMKIFDMIDKGRYIELFNAGVLEKTFNLSLSKSETIQNVKVIGKDGTAIVLRYPWDPATEHINHTAEKYENWIDENFTRI